MNWKLWKSLSQEKKDEYTYYFGAPVNRLKFDTSLLEINKLVFYTMGTILFFCISILIFEYIGKETLIPTFSKLSVSILEIANLSFKLLLGIALLERLWYVYVVIKFYWSLRNGHKQKHR